MTINLQSRSAHDALSARTTTAIRVVLGLSLAAACFLVFAEQDGGNPGATAVPAFGHGEFDPQQLERVFWLCDHAASTQGVPSADGAACAVATEQLKQQKFNGDFEAMLDWWRDNKGAMYQSIDQSAARAEAGDDLPMP